MKKLASIIFCLGLFLPALLPSPAVAKKGLVVYNWSNYIDKNVVIDFEARYKTRVIYRSYDTLGQLKELLEKLARDGDTRADVIIMPAFLLQGLMVENILSPLRPQWIKNEKYVFSSLKNILRKATRDIGKTNRFALPYLWGTMGLVYDAVALKKRLPNFPRNSWRLIFQPTIAAQFSDCGIVLADQPRQILQIIRHYLGARPNSAKRKDLLGAEILLRSIRPYVDVLPSFEAANAFAYGDACLLLGQSPEIYAAEQDNRDVIKEMKAVQGRRFRPPEIYYKLPREGSLLWMDVMVIPKRSKNKRLAHRWINHVLNTENARLIASATGFSTPNRQAVKLLPKQQRDSATLYPSLKKKKIIFDRESLDANDLPATKMHEQELRAWDRFINLK